MVLSLDEVETAENASVDRDSSGKDRIRMASLLQLRDGTKSFIIQCLADREIQKLIYQQEQFVAQSKAYRYNCAVIHSPHAWSRFKAINGHGWDSAHHRPSDPKLRLGRVLSNSSSKGDKRPVGKNLTTNLNSPSSDSELEDNDDAVRRMKETISVLKEQNVAIKKLYLERLQSYSDNGASESRQQVRLLQQEIDILKAQLDSKIRMIRKFHSEKQQLQVELDEMRIALQRMNQSQRSPNMNLVRQSTVRFDDDLPSTRIFVPTTPIATNSRRNRIGSLSDRACCIIM